ncbi:14269_t:CDS:2, partial [Acaulospora morrowiae]
MDFKSILDSLDSTIDDDKFYDNLYGILGCVPSSTSDQISTEYKKLVLGCHPDKFQSPEDKKEGLPIYIFLVHFTSARLSAHKSPDIFTPAQKAETKFHQLTTAYRILCDQTERTQYDRWLTGSIRIPYKTWREIVVKKGHAVHWKQPKQQLQITTQNSSPNTTTTIGSSSTATIPLYGKGNNQDE